MDTQRVQEAYLQKSHINFKILISFAASLFVNGAAIISFLQLMPLHLYTRSNVYDVSIINYRKIQHNLSQKEIPKKALATKRSTRINTQPNKTNTKHTEKSLKNKRHYTVKNINRKTPIKTDKISQIRHLKHVFLAVSDKSKIIKNPTTINKNPTEKIQSKKQKNYPIGHSFSEINISASSNQELFRWIASHKFYPLKAIFNNEEGEVRMVFYIDKRGNIYGIKITKHSFNDLNNAAIKILKDSSPIPARILASLDKQPPLKASLILKFKLEN